MLMNKGVRCICIPLLSVSILVDTGSRHNFIDQQMVKKIGVKLQDVYSFTATVANADKLKAQLGCPSLF